MGVEEFRNLALSFPRTEEAPNFKRASFRLTERIFATLNERDGIATFKLSEIDQSIFCGYDKNLVYPVSNKWGKQGWTFIKIEQMFSRLLTDALYGLHELLSKKQNSCK